MSVSSRRQKLEAMLAADPADQMLRYMLALELEKTSEHDRSLELLQGLMTGETPYVPAFLMAGQQLTKIGRHDEARQCFEAGIQNAQQQGNAHAAGEMQQFLLNLPG
jgi:tetratricopeptide (TPR) repeat protein